MILCPPCTLRADANLNFTVMDENMMKQWAFLMLAAGLSGCVTDGAAPAAVRPAAEHGSATAASVRMPVESFRVVQMPYDEAWTHLLNILPSMIEPMKPTEQVRNIKFQRFDRMTGVIEMKNFNYVGDSQSVGLDREVVCKVSQKPNRKYLLIRLIPAGANTFVWVDATFAQLLKDEVWEPERYSGRIDGLGFTSLTKHGGYLKSAAVYDTCVSTGAIERLVFKAFPERREVKPVEALSMGGFHQFYKVRSYWSEFNNGLPDVSAPHFLERQTQEIANATRQMRTAWEEDAARKKDGWETDAIIRLGIAHAMGYGVKKNEAVAAKWFHKKASNNYIAQYNLGMLALNAGNHAEAAEWFQTAAMQGGGMQPMAKNNLAVMFAQGLGVKKDEAKAVKLFNEVIDLQKKKVHICNVKTIRNLGYMYENGLGVPKDTAQAYGYYAVATRLGDIEAQKSKDMLQTMLGAAEVSRILASPAYAMADCSPLWSGGWHEVP